MPAAQAKHSNPGPLKLVLPPNPCQRPIGTSASNSISSEIFASDSVFGQLISSTPSIEEIAHPRSRLVPNVPSLSLRSLKTGLVRARAACVIAVSYPSWSLPVVQPRSLEMPSHLPLWREMLYRDVWPHSSRTAFPTRRSLTCRLCG